jgi:hypothetical protein
MTNRLDFDGEYEQVPEHLRKGLVAYVEQKRFPGGFLEAVLTNDLRKAIDRGDEKSLAGLRYIVMWLFNRAPSGCWGSPAKVEEWLS